MGRVLLAAIIGGAILLFFGIQEMRLASACKAQPQTISCSDLGAKGPGNNAHVVMTDFLVPPSHFVYEEKGDKYVTVWLPVVPLDGAYAAQARDAVLRGESNLPAPPASEIKVVLMSKKAPNDKAVDRIAAADTVQGVVINKISSIGREERKLLEESYPGVNFDKVQIIEHDRKPASAAKSYGMIGGGAVLAIGALGGVVMRRRAA